MVISENAFLFYEDFNLTLSWFRLCLQMILSNISFNILQFKRIS